MQRVITTLFKKYYRNPRLLPKGILERIFVYTLQCGKNEISVSAVNINDCNLNTASDELKKWNEGHISDSDADVSTEKFVKRRILLRTITDYIAGMTDGFALKEYEKLM